MIQKDFDSLLHFGEEGEKEMAALLMARGNKIIPLYQFNNEKSPLMFGNNYSYILPDLTCIKSGQCFFVEVKTKQRWGYWMGQKETGCDERLYKHYKKVAEDTELPVYIFFNHKEDPPIGIYFCNILNEEPYRRWDGLNSKTKEQINKPIVFWEIKQLKELK